MLNYAWTTLNNAFPVLKARRAVLFDDNAVKLWFFSRLTVTSRFVFYKSSHSYSVCGQLLGHFLATHSEYIHPNDPTGFLGALFK